MSNTTPGMQPEAVTWQDPGVSVASNPKTADDQTQVYFLFDQTGTWPPVPSEGLQARAVTGGYEVLEAPFFVRNVAVGDVVSVRREGDVLWAGERLRWAGHQTLRVNPRRESPDRPSCGEVLAEFAALGVPGEDLEEYDLVTLDVAPDVDPLPVHDRLVQGRASGLWWYEEACVGPGWPA